MSALLNANLTMQFPLVSACKVKKHGVREIVVSALRGQPGNTDFEAMGTKNQFL
jgi:hypothetical protein